MSKTAEEIKTEIAEKLNILSLHTHTYNVDDCLEDVMSIIAPQQKTESFEWLKDHEIVAESGVGYINDTRGSLNFQLGAKWAQSELQERFNSAKLKTSELEKEIQELRVETSNFADWLNENFETTINCAWIGKKGIYKGGVYSSSQLRSIYFEALNK